MKNKLSFKSLTRDVQSLMQPFLKKQGFTQADLVLNWPHFVGQEYASHSRPLKIHWPRHTAADDEGADDFQPSQAPLGHLHMAVAASHIMSITYEKDIILDRINRFFKYRALGDIKFINRPVTDFQDLPHDEAEENIQDHVTSQSLDEAIKQLEKMHARMKGHLDT